MSGDEGRYGCSLCSFNLLEGELRDGAKAAACFFWRTRIEAQEASGIFHAGGGFKSAGRDGQWLEIAVSETDGERKVLTRLAMGWTEIEGVHPTPVHGERNRTGIAMEKGGFDPLEKFGPGLGKI